MLILLLSQTNTENSQNTCCIGNTLNGYAVLHEKSSKLFYIIDVVSQISISMQYV